MIKADEQQPKTLFPSAPVTRPGWLVWLAMQLARVVGFTFLWAGLGMAVGLFLGILGVLIYSISHAHTVEMSQAYRQVAIPAAVFSGGCALLWNLFRSAQGALARSRG